MQANRQHTYDVIVFGLSRSDNSLSSVTKAFADELARNHRVFYIDRPYSLKDLILLISTAEMRRKLGAVLFGMGIFKTQKIQTNSVIQVIPLLTLPINFLPAGKLFNLLNRLNNYIVYKAISKTIESYNVKDYVYLNSFLPVLVPVISKKYKYQPLLNIYQSFDEMSGEPYIAKHGKSAEMEAIRNCDLAIATSSRLCEKHAEASGRKVHLLANGVNYQLFKNACNSDLARPLAIQNFIKPIIIYTGHYSNLRLDSDLIKSICAEFTAYEIVFIGTSDTKDISKYELDKIENLHFIGPQNISQLPAYLKYAKVGIIPNKINELTQGIYPLKVNEYLAAGLPCVSTQFSKDMNTFEPYVYIAKSKEDFIAKLHLALLEDPQQKLAERMLFAEGNSWQKRIEKLENLIADFLYKRD